MGKEKAKSKLKGAEKAAIVLLAMDSDNTAKIFSMLKEDEIKEVSQAMASLGAVESSIIDDVIEEFKREVTTSLSVVGNLDTTEKILEKALGKDRVGAIMEDIRGPMGKNTWDKLSNVSEEMLASYLKNEYPQTIALVLSKLSPAAASRVMNLFGEELAFEVMTRMLKIDSIKKETLERMENVLRSDFISSLSKEQQRDSNELMAEIFNNFDRATEQKYMGMLEEKTPEAAEKVKELMFTFDDMVKVNPNDIATLMKNIDKNKLGVALKGANQTIKDMFINSMSQRAAKILLEDMEALGPIRVKDVDEAQAAILGSLKEMIDNGEVVIASGEGEDEFIE